MDIITVGGISIDHLFKVSRLPKIHFEGEIGDFGTFFGGRAANVVAIAAKLGMKTGIIAPVGNEFVTSGYESHLKKLGVDLSGLTYYPEKSTRVYVFSNPNGDQLTFFYKGVCDRFAEMEVPIDLLKRAKIVHITTSNEPSFNLKIAKVIARQKLPITSFDPGNDPSNEIPGYLSDMIRCIKLLFLNTEEQIGIMRKLDAGRIGDLHEIGPETIIIINKKERSSIILSKGSKRISIPSLITRIVDPTGASDAYVAGFLVGLAKGYGLKQSGMLGTASATFMMESIGCQTNLPSWNQLLDRCLKKFGEDFFNLNKDA